MKKKILMLAVAACLIVLSIASSSLAYFTDTGSRTHVFTSGDIGITLNNEGTRITTEKVFPGQTISTPATITLDANSGDAYVGAIIKLSGTAITDILATAAEGDNIPADVKSLFTGLAANATVDEVNGTYVIKVAFTEALTNSSNSVDIFSKIQIPAEWDHAQMDIFSGVTIEITAYATQTVGFTTAAQALAAAFPTVW